MPSLVHELDADLKPVLVLAWCHWSSIFCLLVKIVSCFEFFSQLAFSQLASSRATESCTTVPDLCAFGVTGHPFFCLLVNFVFVLPFSHSWHPAVRRKAVALCPMPPCIVLIADQAFV